MDRPLINARIHLLFYLYESNSIRAVDYASGGKSNQRLITICLSLGDLYGYPFLDIVVDVTAAAAAAAAVAVATY